MTKTIPLFNLVCFSSILIESYSIGDIVADNCEISTEKIGNDSEEFKSSLRLCDLREKAATEFLL